MLIRSASEMQAFGQSFAARLQAPCVIELLGDVGVGKTTFVQGLAAGLGIKELITSPSFTLSKQYQGNPFRLVHYDFYRLSDPGIMSEDLAETMNEAHTITVVEWGQSIQNILPRDHLRLEIRYLDERTRELKEL